MPDAALIGLIGFALAVLFITPFVIHARRRERASEQAASVARSYGLHEPGTLHPVVDPTRCIGTSACVSVCPEGDVIGFKDGQARAISPACCIGHGLCERACPVEAIQLVFGTAKRGVDIPRIRENYETNVPGIFVVGELGGMGLIRNAFEQGRQCVEWIASQGPNRGDALDLVIVGCGPAGLACALTASQKGLRFEVVERESDLGGTVRHYPRKKLVMTSPVRLPGFGRIGALEMSKEDLIQTWDSLSARAGLQVRTNETVEGIHPRPDGVFEVTTTRTRYAAARVVLAIGRRGVPRKLGVEGENLDKVHYSLLEPDQFQGEDVLVVGGGDSAIEAALALAEQPDTRVRISYRRETFSRLKAGNRNRIEDAMRTGAVQVHWSTAVARIEPKTVEIGNGVPETGRLPNDRVFVFIGGELPTGFLEACGIAIETKFGEP